MMPKLFGQGQSQILKEEYNEFYKAFSNDMDDPFDWVHFQELKAIWSLLYFFFIPKKAAPDIFRADYQSGVKLYVNRVFITDDDKELLHLG